MLIKQDRLRHAGLSLEEEREGDGFLGLSQAFLSRSFRVQLHLGTTLALTVFSLEQVGLSPSLWLSLLRLTVAFLFPDGVRRKGRVVQLGD